MIHTIQEKDTEKLNAQIFEKFKENVETLHQTQNEIFVALSGGRSLITFYQYLTQHANLIDKGIWSELFFCFADERLVPLDKPDSNYKQLYDAFLKELLDKNIITSEQILTVDVASMRAANEYSERVPHVDIALLGVGEDGHTASLFPNHESIERVKDGFIRVSDAPKLPPLRISMSKELIQDTNFVYIFFTGDSKKEAYQRFTNEHITITQCPAKIAKEADMCYVIVNL